MKKRNILLLLPALLIMSCGARKSSSDRTDLKVFETTRFVRLAPGASVYLAAPMGEPGRPVLSQIAIRDTTLLREGDNGAKLTVRLRGKEFVDASCDCPPVREQNHGTKLVEDDSKKKETAREEAVGWKGFVWSFIFGFLVGIIVWITKPWKNLFSWSRLLDLIKK